MGSIKTPRLILSCLVCIALIFATVTYAWLSRSWGKGDFSLTTTSNPKVATYELWTNSSGDKDGWSMTGDMNAANPSTEKALPKIGTFSQNGSGNETFVLKDKLSLFFGVINSLAQEQDNQPVYMKIKFSLEPHTSNKVSISYKLPTDTDATVAYKVDTATHVSTRFSVKNSQGSTTNSEGRPILDGYSFVKVQYAVSESGNYSLKNTDKGKSLPKDVEDMFDEEQAQDNAIVEALCDGSTNESTALINDTDSTKTVYAYIKYSISPKVLFDVLSETDLKYNMPVYLIYNLDLAVELHTSEAD